MSSSQNQHVFHIFENTIRKLEGKDHLVSDCFQAGSKERPSSTSPSHLLEWLAEPPATEESSCRLPNEVVGFLRAPQRLLGEGPPDRKGLAWSKAFCHSCLWGTWGLVSSLAASLGKGGGPPPKGLLASCLGASAQDQPGQPLGSSPDTSTAGGVLDGSLPLGKEPRWGGGARKGLL